MILERFKVPVKDQVFVSEAALRRTVTQIFEKLGLTPEDAAEGADVLTMTDLRGVETHGVSNMLRAYVRDYKAGKLDPRPGWRVVRESPGTALIDAAHWATEWPWLEHAAKLLGDTGVETRISSAVTDAWTFRSVKEVRESST